LQIIRRSRYWLLCLLAHWKLADFVPAPWQGLRAFALQENNRAIVEPCMVGSSGNVETGWTAGGGLEWAFASQWSLRGKYLFVSLASNSLTETWRGREFLRRAYDIREQDRTTMMEASWVSPHYGNAPSLNAFRLI
jgi:hypothetical protein